MSDDMSGSRKIELPPPEANSAPVLAVDPPGAYICPVSETMTDPYKSLHDHLKKLEIPERKKPK